MSLEIEQLLALSEEKIHSAGRGRNSTSTPPSSSRRSSSTKWVCHGAGRPRRVTPRTSRSFPLLPRAMSFPRRSSPIAGWPSSNRPTSTPCRKLVHPRTGRVHTSYNQTVTATGRLSSSNPNLQNIPIRTLEGSGSARPSSRLRWEIVSADYSQIELRVLAPSLRRRISDRGLRRRRGYPHPDGLRHLRGLSPRWSIPICGGRRR